MNTDDPDDQISPEACNLMCNPESVLWPTPTGKFSYTNRLIKINPKEINFEIMRKEESLHSFMRGVTKIFRKKMLKFCGLGCTMSSNNTMTVYIDVKSPILKLTLSTDESYKLEVTSYGKYLRAYSRDWSTIETHGLRKTLPSILELD